MSNLGNESSIGTKEELMKIKSQTRETAFQEGKNGSQKKSKPHRSSDTGLPSLKVSGFIKLKKIIFNFFI
jgi:hypothetical protein